MESNKKTVKLGTSEIVVETGKVARQATGAVIVSSGETQVLSTVVVGKPPGEHLRGEGFSEYEPAKVDPTTFRSA